jgi:thiamine biosynthesis protein ThiS
MQVIANGKPLEFAPDASLQTLLESLGMDCARVAVERNREIVPRDRFAATPLAEGDRLEIVQFVGGG